MPNTDDDICSNPTDNDTFESVVNARFGRRQLLGGGIAAAATTVFAGVFGGTAATVAAPAVAGAAGRRAFHAPVPVSGADEVVIPDGYVQQVVLRWGDPIFADQSPMPADVSHTAAEQERMFGMHCDGMTFFPHRRSPDNLRRGLLVVNHEYTDEELLHADGQATWNLDKVRKSQAAHGVSVTMVREKADGTWGVVFSKFNRRITANTECLLTGPAAGHPSMKTAAFGSGLRSLGTVNNCANGETPWGTYLTCEENFNGYFNGPASADALQARYGLFPGGFGYRWHEFDDRFDVDTNPNEPNTFGWVVEIDPRRPNSRPMKRTALGRFKHESAELVTTDDDVPVVYMGDDERGEYIYKFVGDVPYPEAIAEKASPLDEGTLYVARFNDDGTGDWLPLVQGEGPLTAANGFADQGAVVINARGAADALGATRMDRPEWIASQGDGTVYATLTNNSRRGSTFPVDAANPRADNVYGHIIGWTETGMDHAALTFDWDIFVLCGDSTQADPEKQGNIDGDDFGSPDGLWFGPDGTLWIQTDVSTSTVGVGDYANLGNNQMLDCDVTTGEIRRFLVGPRGCEVTGAASTRDGKYLFVGFQHPGEGASAADPKAVSAWPDYDAFSRPRSSVIVVAREDGQRVT